MNRRWGRASALAAVLLGAACGLSACAGTGTRAKGPAEAGEQPWAPPYRLGPPEYLPPVARDILKARMARHADDMAHVVWSVAALDYAHVAENAERVAGDADFARPLTHDATELNASIPTRFFDLQDDLRARARKLAAAARGGVPLEVSAAYASMSETCVACHAVYRDGPGTGPMRDGPTRP